MPIAMTTLAGIIAGLFTNNNGFGPYAIGQTVTTGSATAYKVVSGDNFAETSPNIITSANPLGKYSTTRTYMTTTANNGPRGNSSGSLALLGYDVDSGHTGYNDINRGTPVASYSDMLTQTSGGGLVLKSRIASSGEIALSVPASTALPLLSSMVSSASTMVFTAPFFIEWQETRTNFNSAVGGSHRTTWMMQMGPAPTYTNAEIDFEEGSQGNIEPNHYTWTTGTSAPAIGADIPSNDGLPHKLRIEVTADGTIRHYIDDMTTPVHTSNTGAVVDVTRPFYWMGTNHVANFPSNAYVASDWTTGSTTLKYGYVAVGTISGVLYTPQIATATLAVNFGAAFSTTLADQPTLWGASVTAENVESWAMESNEPGGNYAGGYRGFPTGVTYNSSTRVLAGTAGWATRPGRMIVSRYVKDSVCTPHRTVINVGPNLSVTSIPAGTVGTAYSYDLYAVCDCGVLVVGSNGQKAKTVVVTGLPNGLSYSDVTGLITGTPTASQNSVVSITITNSVGQSVTQTATYTGITPNVGVVAPTITGSPAVRNSWDFDNLSTLSVSGTTPPQINSVAGTDGASLALANASATTSPTRVLRTNGRYAARFTAANSQFLQAVGQTLASGGTTLMVFEPVTVSASQVFFERAQAAATTTTNREEAIGVAASYLAARRGSSTASADAQTPFVLTAALHFAVFSFDPASNTVNLWIDGRSAVYTIASTGQAVSMDTITMGARMAASALGLYSDSYIYRTIDYSVAFSAQQAEDAATWAATYYQTSNLA